jgi:Domain of unknown function (DUF4263)
MKKFQTIEFDKLTYERELNDFNQLLTQNKSLQERKEILPFFRERPVLSSLIGSFITDLMNIDKIAYEYDLFGDFQCDLVVGDSRRDVYCFIEFEDALPNSVFSEKKTKFKAEFATRLEHGYSQIVDWFYTLKQSNDANMRERFHANSIDYHGILIIGRNQFISDEINMSRLKWRSRNTIVDSKRIHIITYDELYEFLNAKYRVIFGY